MFPLFPWFSYSITSEAQQILTCSRSTIKTLEKGIKYAQS